METGQMQEPQPITHPSPFNQGLFFPDSGRKSTLEALRNAVAGSASLITCIGEEGYGKTTLCKMLEREFSATYIVISFPYSVESFDYVLKIITQKLHLNFSTEDNAQGSGHILMEITKALREQGKRLLILIDEAEKLYLATLERVRKMIDLVNEEEVLLQIILFGRTGLQTHIEQLALCTFKETKELHLTLPPLTEEDTFRYLNFCMPQNPGSAKKDIFSREVAQKILTVSHGNFRKINILAKDSLQSSSYNGNDTSFMVLLEHVRDADDQVNGDIGTFNLPALFAQNKKIFGAVSLLLAIMLFFIINREPTVSTPPSSPQKTQISTNTKTTPPQANKNNPIAASGPLTGAPKPQATNSTPSNLPPVAGPAAQPTRPAPVAATEPAAKAVPPTPALIAGPTAQPTQPAPVAATEPTAKTIQPGMASVAGPVAQPGPAPIEPVAKSAPPTPASVAGPTATTVQPAPTATKEPAGKPISVEIAPLVEKKSSETQVVVANKLPKKNSIPHLTAEPLTKNKELLKGTKEQKTNLTQQLPQKSLAAGASWLAGEKNDHYTLQLIILAADQAKGKIKEILHNEENQKGSEKFIILKKSTTPATFILFYGEYPTMDAARNARNNLPQSLQKYTPYPVSIKQAVEKSKQ